MAIIQSMCTGNTAGITPILSPGLFDPLERMVSFQAGRTAAHSITCQGMAGQNSLACKVVTAKFSPQYQDV